MSTKITTPIDQFASVHEVVMEKTKLLSFLIENKAKHDAILATAVAGYWDIASKKIEEKREKLINQVEDWGSDVTRELDKVLKLIEDKKTLPVVLSFRSISLDAGLGLTYPEDHSQDYERTIKLMESSVYDKVKLSAEEFDSYVLNNWEWKTNFIASNSSYVDAYRTSNRKSVSNLKKSNFQGYNNAYEVQSSNVMVSGCANF